VTVALSTLTAGLRRAERHGPDVDVVDATHDSRQVEPGWLFCAVVGTTTDGHDHAAQAVEQGASALVVERWLDLDVPQVKVPSVRAVLGHVAAAVHDHPSRDLSVVGITGTNGKTTVAYLVEAAAAAHGVGTGVIGTVETRIHGIAQPGVRTTPEGTDLQRLLRRMHDRGVDTVAMEVSSHGLDLRRVDGTRFACIGFTNFSQDHLDWHGSMEAYFAAKARLATPEFTDQAVVCTNDDGGRRFAEEAAANGLAVVTVADAEVDPDADHVIEERALDLDGGRARVRGPDGEREVRTRLVADFNLTNAVVAEVLARRAGIDAEAARAGIAACDGVPGRLERVDTPDDVTVLVDYAHTPDAIVHLLRSLRSLLPPGQRIHLVLGCGGDRDRGKRPLMGAAAMAADVAVLTSDNPRSEDPEAILRPWSRAPARPAGPRCAPASRSRSTGGRRSPRRWPAHPTVTSCWWRARATRPARRSATACCPSTTVWSSARSSHARPPGGPPFRRSASREGHDDRAHRRGGGHGHAGAARRGRRRPDRRGVHRHAAAGGRRAVRRAAGRVRGRARPPARRARRGAGALLVEREVARRPCR
jgi:UDP-N-acetylmuramoyl-L-alanyl-D-glutamate--2,6-diaminopimelate ligase